MLQFFIQTLVETQPGAKHLFWMMVLQVITFSFEAFSNFFSATSVWLKITIFWIFWFYWEITGRNLIWTHSFDRKLVKSWFGKRNMSDSAPGTWFSLQRSYTIQSDFGSNCATESQWTSSQWNCLFIVYKDGWFWVFTNFSEIKSPSFKMKKWFPFNKATN